MSDERAIAVLALERGNPHHRPYDELAAKVDLYHPWDDRLLWGYVTEDTYLVLPITPPYNSPAWDLGNVSLRRSKEGETFSARYQFYQVSEGESVHIKYRLAMERRALYPVYVVDVPRYQPVRVEIWPAEMAQHNLREGISVPGHARYYIRYVREAKLEMISDRTTS